MTYKIVICDKLDPQGLALLQAVPEFEVLPGPYTRDQALAAVADADAVIVRSATKADAQFLEAASNLKIIARAGVGVDNIDVAKATECGVLVMNTPGGNTIAAAEQTFGLMLALARAIPAAHQSMLEGRWDRKMFMGAELAGKTLGIIGLGRIGQAVALRAQAFQMKPVAFDPRQPAAVFQQYNTAQCTLDEVLAQSDFLTLHAPANDSTYNMIDSDAIARMKPGVRIINTARGTLIDGQALAEAIKSGKVAGAAVDVYPEEPPASGYPLIGLSGVIHTPHLGASTEEAQITVAIQAAEQVRDGLLRGDYRNVYNSELLKTVSGGD